MSEDEVEALRAEVITLRQERDNARAVIADMMKEQEEESAMIPISLEDLMVMIANRESMEDYN